MRSSLRSHKFLTFFSAFFIYCVAYSDTTPLNNGTAEEQIEHIEFLVRQNKKPDQKTISSLAQLLDSPQTPVLVQERAVWALGRFQATQFIDAITHAAQSKSLLVRSAALDALMHMRARSGFDVYIKIADQDPVLSMRQRATLALGLLRWEKAVQPLVKLSNDLNPEVRGASCLSMAATHSKKNNFSEVMKEMIRDKDPYVKRRAERGMEIVQRKTNLVQKHLSSDDKDIRLFGVLYFHDHGKGSDLEVLKKLNAAEKDIEIAYEISQAIQAIHKRIAAEKARIEEERKEKERQEAAKKKAAQQKSNSQNPK